MKSFKVNDMVLYGFDGVCKITDITRKTVCGKTLNYYVLKPMATDRSTFYVPVDNPKSTEKMKKVLSPEEITKLIHSMPRSEDMWIENENKRKEVYRQIIADNDREQIIAVIRTLFLKKKELEQSGKKLHKCDETFLKEAEKLLYEEFSLVLDIDRGKIIEYIENELKDQGV